MTINSKMLGWASMLGIMMGWGFHALAESPAGMTLTEAEQSAVFKAAGAVQRSARACGSFARTIPTPAK